MRVHLVKWVCSGSFTAEICRQEEQQKDIQHMWADISSCYDSHRCSVKKEAWVWLQSGLQMCSHCEQVKAVYRLLLRVLHSNVGQQISLSQFYSNIIFHTVSDSLWPAVLHRLSDSPLSISCLSSATIYMLSGEGLIRRPQQVSHPPHQTHCSTSPSCDCTQKPQPASTSRLNSVPCIRQPIRCFKGY